MATLAHWERVQCSVCSQADRINESKYVRTDEALSDLMYYLSQCDLKMLYSRDEHNFEADAISRNPVYEIIENDEGILNIGYLISLDGIIKDQRINQQIIRQSRNIVTKFLVNN